MLHIFWLRHSSVARLPACSEGPGRIQLIPSEAASFLEHSSSLSLFLLCSWPCSLAQVPKKLPARNLCVRLRYGGSWSKALLEREPWQTGPSSM